MQYMGSKNRISKYLLPVILKDRKSNQWYVEPFVGGCNMIDKVGGKRIGNDNNYYLIELWKSLQRGFLPPSIINKETYIAIKNNKENYPPELVAFVGFLCSFGGKWFGGYAQNKNGDNYAERGARCLLKQIKNLVGVKFLNKNYLDLKLKSKCIIYCDPPYANTTKYKDGFNHEEFWNWVRKMKEFGHSVFVSEYNAPDDFECIKEIEHKTILDKNSQYKRIEKLFV